MVANLKTAVRVGIAAVALFAIALPTSAVRAEVPVINKLSTVEFDVRPDGTYTETNHQEFEATNTAAAGALAQLPLLYDDSMHEFDIVEAYTLKADGRKLPVNTKAIFAQLPPGQPNIPMFNAQRQMVVIFPDVAGGDTVVWTTRIRLKQPYFPGQFTASFVFPRVYAYQDANLVVRAPASMPLDHETYGLTFAKETQGTTIVYRWHYSAPDALTEDPAAVSANDRSPRLFVSSFRSFDDLAHAYAALADDKIKVTPKVQALSDALTAGVTDKRKQAQLIYAWVTKNVRYVAIVLGNGGLVPHDPDTIIANAYGDCKDHAIIFASLLKAKGIVSEPVLINLGNGYTIPGVPSLGQLNHLISFLPDYGLYVDTTSQFAPFGTLPIEEYGKPIIHAGGTSPALRRTPLAPADANIITSHTYAKLASDGHISGTSVSAASGPMSIQLRSYGLAIESTEPERMAKARLRDAGSGSFDQKLPDIERPSFSILGHFDLVPHARLIDGEAFTPPTGLELMAEPGDGLMGPLTMTNLSDAEPTPCFSGHDTEELLLELPPGRHVATLPTDTLVETPNLRYTAHWAVADKMLIVRRDFTSTVAEPLCTGQVRVVTAAALAKIREDYRTTISLVHD